MALTNRLGVNKIIFSKSAGYTTPVIFYNTPPPPPPPPVVSNFTGVGYTDYFSYAYVYLTWTAPTPTGSYTYYVFGGPPQTTTSTFAYVDVTLDVIYGFYYGPFQFNISVNNPAGPYVYSNQVYF